MLTTKSIQLYETWILLQIQIIESQSEWTSKINWKHSLMYIEQNKIDSNDDDDDWLILACTNIVYIALWRAANRHYWN